MISAPGKLKKKENELIQMSQTLKIQQSPDNHTMLNHTTLLFAPNLPGIKWNINKFALIIAQKSPDNHTYFFPIFHIYCLNSSAFGRSKVLSGVLK